jgi:hypothetical protein
MIALSFLTGFLLAPFFPPSVPASAVTCQQNQEFIQGKDYGPNRIGNVNGTQAEAQLPDDFSTNHGTVRSIFVIHTWNIDWVEAGWSKGQDYSPVAGSEFFGEEIQDDQNVGVYDSNHSLAAGSQHTFKVHDQSYDGFWHVSLDGGTVSHTMNQVNFKLGSSFTNDEIRDPCDPRWGYFFDAQDCLAYCPLWKDWADGKCRLDTIADYNFDRISANEHKMIQDSSSTSCATS